MFPDMHNFAKNNSSPKRRSTFLIPFNHTGTLNEGALYPFYCEEVLPGDTFNVRTSYVLRALRTPYVPSVSEAYLDTYYFFCPWRILWKYWEKFFGEAEPDEYTNPTAWAIPTLTLPDGGNGSVVPGSVMNGLGIPVKASGTMAGIQALPLAAFVKIRNEWFRDENIEQSDPTAETIYNLASGAVYSTIDGRYGGAVAGQWEYTSVCKYHDTFTSCLPQPQKHGAVTLPLGTTAPVTAFFTANGSTSNYANVGHYLSNGSSYSGSEPIALTASNSGTLANGGVTSAWHDASDDNIGGSLRLYTDTTLGTGLRADLSNATAATINDLRLAVAAQLWYEGMALHGSRYTEILHGEFGVSPLDSRLQRPEFLGGSHRMINMQQVANTSGNASGSSSQTTAKATGGLGAYSLTSDSSGSFIRSFPEGGVILGLAAIRVKHRYSQGVPRLFRKTDKFDFFLPEFDRIGNVPVPKDEIFAEATGTFGFQEAWYEYRSKPDVIAGAVTPGVATDLQAWTYGDLYASAPTLSAGFIVEGKERIDQNLSGSTSVPQFVLDIKVFNKATRPMSINSVPGRLGL